MRLLRNAFITIFPRLLQHRLDIDRLPCNLTARAPCSNQPEEALQPTPAAQQQLDAITATAQTATDRRQCHLGLCARCALTSHYATLRWTAPCKGTVCVTTCRRQATQRMCRGSGQRSVLPTAKAMQHVCTVQLCTDSNDVLKASSDNHKPRFKLGKCCVARDSNLHGCTADAPKLAAVECSARKGKFSWACMSTTVV